MFLVQIHKIKEKWNISFAEINNIERSESFGLIIKGMPTARIDPEIYRSVSVD